MTVPLSSGWWLVRSARDFWASLRPVFYYDEGFPLLAAQLINAGKIPYADFFYQHTPLYAYLTAGWFRLFGDTWRSALRRVTISPRMTLVVHR